MCRLRRHSMRFLCSLAGALDAYMLLHSESIRLDSAAAPDAVVGALQATAAEWRESKLSDAARAGGILGWKVRMRGDRIVIRARIGGRNGFLPHFVGRVNTAPGGSVLIGELRLSWFPRMFMLIWLSLAGGAPVIALFEPVPGFGIRDHIFGAFFMLVPAIGLFSFGLSMTRRSWAAPAAAFKDLLSQACTSSPKPSTSSPTREASNER